MPSGRFLGDDRHFRCLAEEFKAVLQSFGDEELVAGVDAHVEEHARNKQRPEGDS